MGCGVYCCQSSIPEAMKKIAAILLLWLPFSLAAIVAVPVLLFGIMAGDESIWKPVGSAMDRLMATLFGYSGRYTLSACLGTGTRYQWLRWFVDLFESGHCAKAAKTEGLIR